MVQNIQFESALSDDRKMVYIITFKKGNETMKASVKARDIDEASAAFREYAGEDALIIKIIKETPAEYNATKLR